MTASLRVIEPGVAATLQDCGREGYQRFGVPVSGALDRVSLAIANILVGNAPHEAALEVLAAGLTVMVCAECVTLAVAGMADPFVLETAQAVLRIPSFQSITARRGEIVRFPPPKEGAVFYVAAAGGFDIPSAFGSRSTYRRAALGGFHGRALQAGDDLPLRLPDASAREPLSLDVSLSAPDVLRVMRGPNAEYFKPSAFETLLTSAYTIAPASDRMGLRLQGAVLGACHRGRVAVARHDLRRPAGPRRRTADPAPGRQADNRRLSPHRDRDRSGYRSGGAARGRDEHPLPGREPGGSRAASQSAARLAGVVALASPSLFRRTPTALSAANAHPALPPSRAAARHRGRADKMLNSTGLLYSPSARQIASASVPRSDKKRRQVAGVRRPTRRPKHDARAAALARADAGFPGSSPIYPHPTAQSAGHHV